MQAFCWYAVELFLAWHLSPFYFFLDKAPIAEQMGTEISVI